MKVSPILLAGALLLVSLGLNFSAGNEGNTIRGVHNPIYIEGNSNFTYANGVVGGSGTQSDPYVIQNWEIDCTNAHGIWVANTSLYFVIRNVVIRSANLSTFNGIYFTNLSNARIENVSVENAMNGFAIFGVKNLFITSATASNCSFGFNFFGIEQGEMTGSIFKNNTNAAGVVAEGVNIRLTNVHVETTGMRLIGVNNSEISSCYFKTEDSGLSAEDCNGLSLLNNMFLGCSIFLIGEELSAYNTHTFSGNTVNGKEVLYVKNLTGQIITGSYGEIILASVSDSTISSLNLSDTNLLIEIAYSQRINVNSVALRASNNGLYVIGCADVHIRDTHLSDVENGIFVVDSASLSIDNSEFNNTSGGITITSSTTVTISQSHFANSTYGVVSYQSTNLILNSLNFTANTQAVSLMTTENSQIRDCKFVKNEVGVRMSQARANKITKNLFIGTTHYAIIADAGSTNNTIYENAFLLNHYGSIQCSDNGVNNRWYNGTQGNFWDDWCSPDANNDSIVDVPYQLDGQTGSKDNYPLTNTPLPLTLSVMCTISPQEIYTNEYASFTIHVFWLDMGIPNAYVEFSPRLGNITAMNYTDENGVISGTYASGNEPGVENISLKITRPGFLTKTASITINILEYPSLQINLSPLSSTVYGGENTTVSIMVHSKENPVEGAMLSLSIEPYAMLSESTLLTDANGSASVLLTFPAVDNQTIFRLYVNATKTGYSDGYAWCDITVNPLKKLEVNVSCAQKVVSNTTTELTITIKSENQSVSAVNITLSSDFNCTFGQSTGITDLNGKFQTTIKIPYIEFETIVKIYLHAWKQSYSDYYSEFEIAVGNPPQNPQNLTGEGLNGKVILRWNVATGAKIYYVYRSEVLGGEYTLIGNASSEGFEDTDVVNGHTYYYKVRAENDYGTSDWSNEIGVTPHGASKITPGFEIFFWLMAICLGAVVYLRKFHARN